MIDTIVCRMHFIAYECNKGEMDGIFHDRLGDLYFVTSVIFHDRIKNLYFMIFHGRLGNYIL